MYQNPLLPQSLRLLKTFPCWFLHLHCRCKSSDWKFNITFEYTAKESSDHTHMLKSGITALCNKGRKRANVPLNCRLHLYLEAYKTSINLDGLVLVKTKGKISNRYEHMFGKNPLWANHLRTFGEVRTMKIKGKFTPQLSDCSALCMIVGYFKQHNGDVYCMWNSMKRKTITRNNKSKEC